MGCMKSAKPVLILALPVLTQTLVPLAQVLAFSQDQLVLVKQATTIRALPPAKLATTPAILALATPPVPPATSPSSEPCQTPPAPALLVITISSASRPAPPVTSPARLAQGPPLTTVSLATRSTVGR